MQRSELRWLVVPCALCWAVVLGACSDDATTRTDGGQADAIADEGPAKLDGPRLDAPADGPHSDGPRADGSRKDAATTMHDGPRADSAPPPGQRCAPLPAASGTIVNVTPAQAATLAQTVAQAASGTTIRLADGTYKMQGSESQRRLTFSKPNVTLRSASGDRTKVIIDGEYTTLEAIVIKASNVTIADLTVTRAVDHPIHVTGSGTADIKGTRLYNLVVRDGGEQFVKVNSDGQGHFADEGRLECSFFELTAAGRPHIEPNPGGCYTGGIDTHGGRGWVVADNTFVGIRCENGSLAEHAIHFWSQSRDTVVERNLIVDCARGIGFGLGQTGATRAYADNPYPGISYVGHYDGVIRNNVIHAGGAAAAYFDTGIELGQARGVRVYHNTVVSQATFSSIDYRWGNTVAELRNNLVWRITVRNGAQGTLDHNLENAPASLFVAPAARDYHLKASASAAIDKGAVVAEAGLDIDGLAHDHGPPDLGAHEWR